MHTESILTGQMPDSAVPRSSWRKAPPSGNSLVIEQDHFIKAGQAEARLRWPDRFWE